MSKPFTYDEGKAIWDNFIGRGGKPHARMGEELREALDSMTGAEIALARVLYEIERHEEATRLNVPPLYLVLAHRIGARDHTDELRDLLQGVAYARAPTSGARLDVV